MVAGAALELPVRVADDEGIESYRVLVNGTVILDVPFVDQASVVSSAPWTVPATASPGDVITVRLEARDFAGQVGSTEATLTVTAGTFLSGDRTVADTYAGQTLMLSKGTFTVNGPLHVGDLILQAAVLKSAALGSVNVIATGRVEVSCSSRIDVTGLGYAGGGAGHPDGYAPAGVTPSSEFAGGSHGGRGGRPTAGDTYDSVYEPTLGGGGGATKVNYTPNTGAGGGVVRIEAGQVELLGEIQARGVDFCGSPGAGGSVSIQATTVSGTGVIDASGGNRTCVGDVNPGGGGRVSIVTGAFNGFDPATQVKAWGGQNYESVKTYAAPGTVFFKASGDVYGTLMLDAGVFNGADRVSPSTQLPVLGGGAVTGTEVAGADLWVSASPGFAAKWLKAWVRLKGTGGADLGVFQAVAIDGAGRLRLAGAGGASGVASYQGEYRFDRVELRHGAGLDSQDAVQATDSVFSGNARLDGPVVGTTATVRTGAVLRPARGDLRISLSGKLTIEATARLDVSGQGYAGGTGGHPDGYAPSGVAGSSEFAGGSHGGRGGRSTAGEVYDSVYEPTLGGGGGASKTNYTPNTSAGGGVVRIEAGEVELLGEIRALGIDLCGSPGAGGTVLIQTATMSGTGSIDASGGNRTCVGDVNPGGGGRVSIVTGVFNGFDPAVQIKTWGGQNYETVKTYAAPGTIFYKKSGDTYGSLLIDAGEVNGVDRVSPATELPVLGSGAVTATAVAGGDLWLSTGSGFAAKWRGAWVRLRDGSGADVGTFRVAEIDGTGRLRLAGAGSVTGVASYQGEYRFDRIESRNGSGLQAGDPIVGPELVLEGNAQISGTVSAANVLIKSGAVVRPATGGELRIVTPGRLTVEAGAVLELSGLGYAGGGAGHPDGYAPAGVTPSSEFAGGSHGGRGGRPTAGDTYDSVYEPTLGGGGGATKVNYTPNTGAGGGVVRIEAGQVELLGEIRARGVDFCGSPGAGGSVSIQATTVSGTGLIDASGGNRTCVGDVNPGGGGRVSIVTGAFNGFDPATQVKAWGGQNYEPVKTYGAPGTIFYKKGTDTYGSLLIDAGEVNGVDRVSPATELPVLGNGAVTATAVSSTDLWVSAGSGFAAKWRGAWVRLRDGSGADVGTFRVAEIDGTGRLRLAGAGSVTGAASYAGEYRFDQVESRNGSGLQASDPIVGPELVLEGNAQISGTVSAANVLVKSGAVVRPATGGELRIVTPGRLTVEAGAVLELSGLGYAGGGGGHPDGYGPAGVTPSSEFAGGSHGGRGGRSTAGEVYDSVYEPTLGGGGGATKTNYTPNTGAGGGVVRIEAGEVELLGEIRARGVDICGSPGAGGSVSIQATTVSGPGVIDASGGSRTCVGEVNPGGGGRVSIVTGAFNGFDPASQIKAWGGQNYEAVKTYAAPGTVFFKKSGDVYGTLLLDAGVVSGADRVSPPTQLPVLGGGAVTGTEVAGADLWVSASPGFAAKWLKVWVRLKSTGGVDLGAFQAVAIDGTGRLRLAGAGEVSGVASYQGEYRFDRVELRHGAGLDSQDAVESTDAIFSGNSRLDGPVVGSTATVRTGAVLRPSRSDLRISLSGKLTVEANARLDVSGQGYAGGTGGHPDGYAPSGVAGSSEFAGGSHGGRGGRSTAGEVYDSVYEPTLGGGGGASKTNYTPNTSAGGGVVRIEAGEVELLGEIRALGIDLCGSPGAGGTVLIQTATMSGTGSIDASGGNRTCVGDVNPGGGGRVSIVTGVFNGFDPAVQIKTWGGQNYETVKTYAAPGTIFYKKSGDTYGSLLIDAGEVNGVDRVSPATELPVLGSGAVTATAVAGGDLWLSTGSGFAAKWRGAWVRLRDGSGADVGTFRVAEIDGTGRLRLAGAGSVTGVASYQGEYRFDRGEAPQRFWP